MTWSLYWVDASGQTWWLTPEWEWTAEYEARLVLPTLDEANRFAGVLLADVPTIGLHFGGDCPGAPRCGVR